MSDIAPVASKHEDSSKKGLIFNKASTNSLRPGSAQLPQYSEIWEQDGGKEVVSIEDGKEVVPHQGLEPDTPSDEKHVAVPHQEKEAFLGPASSQADEQRRLEKRICGIRKGTFLLILGILIAGCIAVGVALGVTLGKGHKNAPSESFSKIALTGIDFDDPFDEPGQAADPLADLFYQRPDGVIRQATMLMNGTWLGAAANENVATDARNGTPIAVTQFTIKRTNLTSLTMVSARTPSRNHNRTCDDCFTQRHLFYIDKNGILRERLFSTVTKEWTDGTLAQLGMKPVAQPALQVCTGNDFVGNGSSSFRDGLSVFFGSSNNTIQQVGWSYGDTKWVKEQTFLDVNGHGGVACNINPWMSYVVMQNSTDVQFYWRDSNYSKRGNSSHPVGVWQIAAASIPGIYPGASLNMRAYGQQRNRNRYIITQMADLSIRAYNMTGQAENMELAPIQSRDQSHPSIAIANSTKALPGTKMAFTADSMKGGRNATKRTWINWLQTDPGYITQFTASSEDLTKWTESHISITD